MPWDALVDSQILAIHAALMPTSDEKGEILYFGGDQHDQGQHKAVQVDSSRRYDCASGSIMYVKAPTSDVFCSGHALLADGRLLVAGGTAAWTGDPAHMDVHTAHFRGHRRSWVYSPWSTSFTEIAPMRPEPGKESTDEGGGRWYPTLITLATGQVLAVSGHPAETDSRHYNNTPERYLSTLNEWRTLPAFGNPQVERYYPRMHLLPDGEVFISSEIAQLSKNVRYNPWTGSQTEICDLPNGDYRGFSAPSVLLPLLPGDNYKARVLVCGGITAQKVNLQDALPSWTTAGNRSGSAAGKLRLHSCAVILPTGQVLLTGGVTQTNPEAGVKEPEIYDPAINWDAQGAAYRDNGTDLWTTIEEPSAEVRNYHSTALLMPDGRVWTGGSSRNAQPGHPANSVLMIQVFTPPYPAGARPVISSSPSRLAYGQSFDVETPEAESIKRVALIRCGSVTHAFDSDQRYVGLNFTRNENRLQVTAPPHGGIAPPGFYMLFIIDSSGRPCTRARFVRVGGEMYVVTDRSFFSQTDVQALPSPARFTGAFYLIFDGYLPSETGLPAGPTINFEWSDGGGAAPGLQAELADTLFENGSAVPNVSQRVAFRYTIRFDSQAAFNQLGASDQRSVRVIARLGSVQSAGTMTFFRKTNPYMRDGDPHWLSVDLRVVQMTPGQSLAGAAQAAGAAAGTDFVQHVLTNFNKEPEDDQHPFAAVSTNQQTSKLELASHRGGQPVFNYAFAKVRLRAPATVSATDVRVFFRLFTTAATSLEFNQTTTYRRWGDGPNAAPLLGVVGGKIASIPFFSVPREGDMTTQPDAGNRRTLSGAGATEGTAYFGCWLDFNQTTPRFPAEPGASNGPFTGSLKSIQELVRGLHQCLVAEVHSTEVPVPHGATPGSSDKLAQRNLAIVESSNPTTTGSHIVPHTFELSPSKGMSLGDLLRSLQHPEETVVRTHARSRGAPDELMIRFYDLPRDSIVSLYLPEVNVDEILEVAALRNGPGMLRRVDDKTIQCRVGDVAFVPLPGGQDMNIPGLLTVELPPGVRQGQAYKVTAHQISGIDRRVIGTFQLTIPVRRSDLLLDPEEHNYAVLKHIDNGILAGDRWRRVFDRYVGLVGDRVRGFGGDPDEIEPSPAGTSRQDEPSDEKARKWSLLCCLSAWLLAFALGLALFSFGVTEDWTQPLRLAATGAFAAGIVWFTFRCKPSICDLAALIGIGGIIGAGILALVLVSDERADTPSDLLANQYAAELLAWAAIVSAGLLLVTLCADCRKSDRRTTARGTPGIEIDKQDHRYFFRYTTFWLIALMGLAFIYSWLYTAPPCVGDSCLDLSEVDPVADLLPLAVPWFGALGAVTSSLYGIIKHTRDWDSKWNYWHLARPIVGAVLGTVAFFIFFILAEVANGGSGNSLRDPELEALVLYYLTAFLVGYREATFQKLLERLSDIVLKPGDSSNQNEPSGGPTGSSGRPPSPPEVTAPQDGGTENH